MSGASKILSGLFGIKRALRRLLLIGDETPDGEVGVSEVLPPRDVRALEGEAGGVAGLVKVKILSSEEEPARMISFRAFR